MKQSTVLKKQSVKELELWLEFKLATLLQMQLVKELELGLGLD